MVQWIKTFEYFKRKEEVKILNTPFLNFEYQIWLRNLIKTFFYYKTSFNLSYFWNFGSLAGLIIVSQILTGILLAMWYVPSIEHAFLSIDYIMREVQYGWLLR